MKKNRNVLLVFCLLLLSCAAFAKKTNKPLEVTHLSGDFYVYVTYGTLDNGSRVASNSMYIVTDKGVVMIDVPWDTTQTIPLLDLIEKKHHRKVIACISTHFHKDRTAGLDILKSRGIRTYATRRTNDLCRERKEQQPEYLIDADTVFDLGNHRLQTFYPGPGHTPDNIVIWFPQDRVLYGGCFVKSQVAEDLGNLSDADPGQWDSSVRKVQQAFKNPRFIIPGHDAFKSTGALEHTLVLIKEYQQQHKKGK